MKRQFPKNSGLTGFYREDNTWQCTGSRIGRQQTPTSALYDQRVKLRVRRIRLDSGGYDDGGAYWGTGAPLWQARGETEEEAVSLFTRADSKAEAIQEFLKCRQFTRQLEIR